MSMIVAFCCLLLPECCAVPDCTFALSEYSLCAAQGDGVTDDWEAIQTALWLISGCSGSPHPPGNDNAGNTTVFLPAGKYKISQTLTMCNGLGAHVRGARATARDERTLTSHRHY